LYLIGKTSYSSVLPSGVILCPLGSRATVGEELPGQLAEEPD
jgi:hypothetical protein